MALENTDGPKDVRGRLLAHFSGDVADQPDRWSELWDQGDFLPWDKGLPNPALTDLLYSQAGHTIGNAITSHSQRSGQRRRKVLVPGCGRGYDVLLFASSGFDAYGLEISDSAVRMCREEQGTHGDKYPIKDESQGAGKAKFLKGDFFSDEWTKDLGIDKFDVIYDYTVRTFVQLENRWVLTAGSQFLCALPPSLRPAWALRMKQLLGSVGWVNSEPSLSFINSSARCTFEITF